MRLLKRSLKFFTTIIFILALAGCSGARHAHSSMMNTASIEPIPENGIHRVLPGESFYALAWRYGLDYRDLANRNGLKRPYNIMVGEQIYLRGQSPRLAKQDDSSTRLSKAEREPNAVVSEWRWPAQGKVIGGFGVVNKGINIAGRLGEPIYASALGKVVYCGNGLRSYGNLIIIKHNNTFLTAYAHARNVFVKAGDWVKTGQIIAEMGDTGTNRVMLHFEIRRDGQPQNPLEYLVKKRYNKFS